MKTRREFLRLALAGGALYGSGALPVFSEGAWAAGFPPVDRRVLVKLMLQGGPDMRHLFPPAFDADPQSFGYRFWQAKAAAHELGDSASAWETRWNEDYFAVAGGGVEFGIRNTCGWLKDMWDTGKLAIVNNAVGGTTRDHAHCIDIIDQGDTAFAPNQAYHAGWGGRLATQAGGNVLALTTSPRPFCFTPDPADPAGHGNEGVVPAADMRNITLYRPPAGSDPTAYDARVDRALSSYYAAKRSDLPEDSPFRQFVDLERKLRDFGEPIDERLAGIPVPAGIEALLGGGLSNFGFALQIRNLHDAYACYDILNMRVASLEYGGWDSHQDQVGLIEPKLADIFGSGKAFDRLFQSLPQDALDNTVIVIAGEFGRQLRANGDAGTDHGEGNSMLVIGNRVRGGVYGEMFPENELARLDDPSPQIEGLTGIDHVFGAVCDWVEAGSGGVVFPGRAEARLEPGAELGELFL